MYHELEGLRPHERSAAVAIAAVMGARVRAHDVDGRQGAVDVELDYPGGSVAALEITSHAGEGVRQRDALLAAANHKWAAPTASTWEIRVPGPQVIPELREWYRDVIRLLEEREMTDTLSLNPWNSRALPGGLQWVVAAGVSFFLLSADPMRQPVVYVLPEGTGGIVDMQLAGLTDAIAGVLALDNQRRHVEKLLGSPHEEKHLFIALHEGGLPFPQTVGLMGPEVDLPACEPPALPTGITHLWFNSTLSHTLAEVHKGQWRFHELGGVGESGSGG